MQTQPSPGGPSRRAVVAGLLGAALAAGCEGSDGGARETPSAGGAAPTGTATGSVTTSPAASGAPQRLRMGVNYVPSEHWWYSWTNWRPSSLAADLESIASLGLDHIRIMCMWPEFQPNQAFVSAELISRLVTLLDLADDAGLDVEVTVFNGAVSGFLFLPSWLLDRAGDPMVRDFLTDPGILDAERALELGILSEIVDDDAVQQTAYEVAAKLAAGPRGSHRAIRHLVHASATASLSDHLTAEAASISALGASAEGVEGVDAFLAKRAPDYRGVR